MFGSDWLSVDRRNRWWPQILRPLTVALLTAFLLLFFPNSAAAQRLERWIYASANLLVPEQVEHLEQLMREAAPLGYTHVLLADSKLSRLHELDERYSRNVVRIQATAAELGLKLIPAVFPVGYSNSLLAQNPNLAEGLPVRSALFTVRNGVAQIQADPPVALPSLIDRRAWTFVDDTLQLEEDSLLADNPRGKNCRAMQTLRVAPWRHYHVSVLVKTEDFRGQPQIQILEPETGRRLCFTNLRVQRSQDWTVQHVTFNSLGNSTVNLYIGAWGAAGGRLWLKDAAIEECGLLNVLRRPGTPLQVRRDDEPQTLLKEGSDFDPVADPKLGSVPYRGQYEVFHESPGIQLRGTWADGTRLRVSWYHPHVIYDEQVCGCVTEPEFQGLLKRQAEAVEQLFPDTDRMMSHDEWRVLGWDESFRGTGLTPGQVAADNLQFCIRQLRSLNSRRRIAVWSDMFDPHHNAIDHYYLVNGDLAGSWDGLSRDVIVVNWNFGVREESLKFFADRGQRQVLAGFYDADAGQIGEWLKVVREEKIRGVIGVMYTTWKQDYSQLREFADVVNRFEETR